MVERVRIVQGEGLSTKGTKLYVGDQEIKHVLGATITLLPNDVARAEISVVADFGTIDVNPLLSLESLKAAAAVRGLVLISRQELDAEREYFRRGDARMDPSPTE